MAKQSIIAIVEDNPGTAKAIELMLKDWGFGVELYGSAEFIARWRHTSATCLLIGVHLRDISGIELSRHLRMIGCDLPAVFVGTVIDETTQRQAAELGLALLQKPFSSAQLVQALHDATGGAISKGSGPVAF